MTDTTAFNKGDLITYPGFPGESYKVLRRHGQMYDIEDAHHCMIIRVSLTGCSKVAS